MSVAHRPDHLLNYELIELRATEVVVVLVELSLKTDHQVALGSGQ
jgi:hypothetical protein